MMKKKQPIFFMVIVLVLGIASCESNAQIDTDINSTKSYNQAYPYPIESLDQPSQTENEESYPISTVANIQEQIELNIPTPNSDSGIIFGEVQSLTQKEPVSYTSVFLASKVFNDSEESYVLSISENSSPSTKTLFSGEFVISNIPPGEYTLVLVPPTSAVPILDKSGAEIEIIIEGGKCLDLGILYVDWPSFDR
ncbi:MAG: hypothetical protein SVT56_08160 [Chloroflexota bacterium]|jgi:hypothetical protein|nr:hypothetical protein [Chloroflexota bacterium]